MKVEGEIITVGRKELAFYIVCIMLWSALIGFLVGL